MFISFEGLERKINQRKFLEFASVSDDRFEAAVEIMKRDLSSEDWQQLSQARVISMAGISGSGKTMFTQALLAGFRSQGIPTYCLQNDELRLALFPTDAGYSLDSDSRYFRYSNPRSDLLYIYCRFLMADLLRGENCLNWFELARAFVEVRGTDFEEIDSLLRRVQHLHKQILQENRGCQLVIHDATNMNTEGRQETIKWISEFVGPDEFLFFFIDASVETCRLRADFTGESRGYSEADSTVVDYFEKGIANGRYSSPTPEEGVYVISVYNS